MVSTCRPDGFLGSLQPVVADHIMGPLIAVPTCLWKGLDRADGSPVRAWRLTGSAAAGIKAENMLLDKREPPNVKISSVGYYKATLDTVPKSRVGSFGFVCTSPSLTSDGRASQAGWLCKLLPTPSRGP